MAKFSFKIKTRVGTVVDNLMVTGRDRSEGERNVKQIYHQCEILDCSEIGQASHEEGLNFESAITLIGKEEDREPPAGN